MIRLTILLLCSVLMVACSTPGRDCDSCAKAEATAGPNSQAAAAAADGGMKATNAPFSGEAGFAARTDTIVGRGGGATSQTTQDTETRETASGGAQNISVMGNPTDATAKNEGGGVSAAVQEAAKSVASARRAYSLAVMDPATTDARLEFLADQVTRAQEMLNSASASSKVSITNNYNQYGNPTLIGVSTSKTGKQDGLDPEATAALAGAASEIATSESSFPPPAPREGEAPSDGAGGTGDGE